MVIVISVLKRHCNIETLTYFGFKTGACNECASLLRELCSFSSAVYFLNYINQFPEQHILNIKYSNTRYDQNYEVLRARL